MKTALTLPALSTIFVLAFTIGAAAGLSVSESTSMQTPRFEAPAGPGAPLPMLPEGARHGGDPDAPATDKETPAGPALAM